MLLKTFMQYFKCVFFTFKHTFRLYEELPFSVLITPEMKVAHSCTHLHVYVWISE